MEWNNKGRMESRQPADVIGPRLVLVLVLIGGTFSSTPFPNVSTFLWRVREPPRCFLFLFLPYVLPRNNDALSKGPLTRSVTTARSRRPARGRIRDSTFCQMLSKHVQSKLRSFVLYSLNDLRLLAPEE